MSVTPESRPGGPPADRGAPVPRRPRPFLLGGRGSRLARAYADRVIVALTEAAAAAGIDVEIDYVPITTTADRHTGDLAAIGGKGLFVREVDRALAAGEIHAAVYAMKDVPGDVPDPPGLTFAAYLARDDVRDALVVPAGSRCTGLTDLPAGARVGTSAVRRRAQILRVRPDVEVVPFRGNVVPRIRRLDEQYRDGHAGGHGDGEGAGRAMEGLVLARGGLAAVSMGHRAVQVFAVEQMCPAVGAGVLGLRCRTDDPQTVGLLRMVDHTETRARIDAERAMLSALGGHCNSPISGHCHVTADGRLSLVGMVFDADGGTFAHAHEYDLPAHARDLGAYVAAALMRQDARAIIDRTAHTADHRLR